MLNFIKCSEVLLSLCAFYSHNKILNYVCRTTVPGISKLKEHESIQLLFYRQICSVHFKFYKICLNVV